MHYKHNEYFRIVQLNSSPNSNFESWSLFKVKKLNLLLNLQEPNIQDKNKYRFSYKIFQKTLGHCQLINNSTYLLGVFVDLIFFSMFSLLIY